MRFICSEDLSKVLVGANFPSEGHDRLNHPAVVCEFEYRFGVASMLAAL
jgi:hypothetical protein